MHMQPPPPPPAFNTDFLKFPSPYPPPSPYDFWLVIDGPDPDPFH